MIENILSSFMPEANGLLNNPSKLDKLLLDAESMLRAIPNIGETASGLPVMIAMLKSQLQGEYAVQPRTLVTIVAALLYLLKQKDLIPDSIPVIGYTDDIAVLIAALKFLDPELKAYREWRDQGKPKTASEAK